MNTLIAGRFYIVGQKALGGTGYTVRDHLGRVVCLLKRKAEAIEACNRLNVADGSRAAA